MTSRGGYRIWSSSRLLRSAAIAIGLLAGGCTVLEDSGTGDSLTVGAVTFAENQIVAEMYALVLEDAGFEVQRRFNFQNREGLHPEMRSGDVDLAPEYLSSLLNSLEEQAESPSDPGEALERLDPLLDERGLELLHPAAANDTNALVVDAATARKLDLDAVSDLAPHAKDLVFGGPPECPERRFCLTGLREVYDLEFASFKSLDPGGPLTTAALSSGEIDVALLFSTSGIIADRGWVVLKDDRGLQAAENITPLIRSDVLTREIEDRLNAVSAELTTSTMTQLNARVEAGDEDAAEVARGFLEERGLL